MRKNYSINRIERTRRPTYKNFHAMDPTYLCFPSFFKYTNMEILLILLDMDRTTENPVIPPSKYLREMTCSTEERLEKLKSINRKEKIRRERALNMLKAIPDIIVFQKYSVGDILTVPVHILNTYEISKPVRVVLDSSTIISLTCPSGVITTKVAPGMAYQVNVNFTVHEQTDYRHYVTVISEEESFFIPIICLSQRPLLDIPDKINLPPIPVKTTSERFIIVRNLGEIPASFNITCSPGFCANPTRGCINAQEYIELGVKFVSDIVGDHRGRLVLTYESSERLTVTLEASTYESDVFLENADLEYLDTYMTLKRKRFVKLYNRSKHMVKYAWKQFKNADMDRLETQKYEERFRNIKQMESKKYAQLLHEGIIAGGDAHDVICERIYQDELKEFRANDPLLYNHLNWGVYPLTGEIWPDNFTNFLITFAPTQAEYYETTMYLEVSGRQERLSLKMYGRGKGPNVQINICDLNANDIFLCSKHQYEVSIRNSGHIPGNISFIPKPMLFGGTLSCNPLSSYLDPNRYASFVLSFTSNVQGPFIEEIEFLIQESREVKKIVFRGNIVCPLLNFDVTEINFGKVTLGYPVSVYINLINTTQVPIEYVAQFFEDGQIPALSCSDYANEVIKPVIILPKELSFQPEKFTVLPNFTSKGQLTLLPNVEGEWMKRLVIIMWGTPKYSISLPIQYTCEIPDVVCETQDIFMRGCFVNYVYTRLITIRSRNEHAGYFEFLPYDVEGPSEITFEPKPSEDFIEGYGVKEVELSIFTKHIGQSTLKVYISIFGGADKIYLCTIRCNGQGPVITVPEVLYFEDIRTLKTVSQMLKIVNDSPVPAAVTVTHNKKSCCTIDDDRLILNPSESLDLEVKAYVRIPGQFRDRVTFTTEQGESQSCLVKVTAVGSSILCEPEIEPEINLGTILTYQTFVLHVKFTNMGKKHHKIIWSRLKKLKSFRDDPAMNPESVFSLKPNVFDLSPDQSIDCVLSACGTRIGHLEEDFYCHAVIEGRRDHAIITSFLLIAEFVKPMMEMSHKELHFRIDTGVDKTTAFLIDTVTIKNVSQLAITTNIRIENPFYIQQDNNKVNMIEKHLENEDVLSINIEFVPKATNEESVTWNKELIFTYLGHPHKDRIPVKGEEHFPNLEIEPMSIDFDYLPNFFGTSFEIVLKNVSPLPLTFQWEWIRDTIQLERIDVVPINWHTTVSEEPTIISTISEPTIVTNANLPCISTDECEEEGDGYHRRLEIDVVSPPLMTAELTNAPPPEQAIITIVERVPEYEKELQIILYQLVKCYEDDHSEIEALKCLPDLCNQCRHCCELFDLVPTYGFLGPYEAQMISMEFSPYPNTVVIATAHCHPSGGKTKTLQIRGGSSNISFSLESDVIEFGRQLFCEICEQTIVIKNTGFAPLEIEPFENEIPECELAEGLPPSNWYNVSLSKFAQDYEVRVRFFPGEPKEFTQTFSLQIGYLPPYSLTIHGFGVLTQIFCALPRPSLNDETVNFLSYRAIASLTSSFLRDVKSLTQIDMKWKEDIQYNVREVLKSNDWVIISINDDYPTVADIQMAIERSIVDIYVSSDYNMLYGHTIMKNTTTVSNKLVAPPYLLDFGFIIRDTEAHYTAIVLNYGPVSANIRAIWSRKNATRLSFRAKLSRSCLQVGASTELCITFAPTTKIFPSMNNLISETIFILVSHGHKIPIEVKAHVTVPEATLSEKHINFNEVTMGCCLRRDVTLENTGYVICNWEAKVEMEKGTSWKPAFCCKTTSGTLDVGEKVLLELNFEPTRGGKFKGYLTIIIEQNPNKSQLKLKGVGMKPTLKITENKLEFPSTLPYTENVEITFSVENVSPFPIEFFFSDFEEQVYAEDLIVSTLMDYYKSHRLYIPHKRPGDSFPAKITEFYDQLLKSLREKLNLLTPKNATASFLDIEERQPKRRGSISSYYSRRTNASGVIVKDPLSSKSPEEIQSLLRDHIRLLKEDSTSNKDIQSRDPIGESIEETLRQRTFRVSTNLKNGVLIIFHGAPQTDYINAANKAGLVLKLPTVNVDKLFFDALVRPATLAAIKVRQILDEAFFSVASEVDIRSPPDYDEYDFLQKKIDLLLTGKKKRSTRKSSRKEAEREKKSSTASKKSSKKGSKKSSQKSSDKSSKSSKKKKEKKPKKEESATSGSTAGTGKAKVDKRPTLIGISEQLLYEILESQLVTYDKGVIIESLESMFVRRPLMLFNLLLRGAGNIRYIHCIIFPCTYKDYVAQLETEKIKNEAQAIEDKKNKIEEIMNMNAEEYANLSSVDQLLFKAEVLVPRKTNSQKKHGELLQRLANKKKKADRKKDRRPSKTKRSSVSKLSMKEKETKKGKKSKSKSKSKSNSNSKKSSKSSKSSKTTKSSKSSKGSKKGKKGKGNKKEKGKSTEQEIKKVYINSENVIWEMLHILEYWDRKNGLLTKPLPSRLSSRQSAKKSKSAKTKSSASSKRSYDRTTENSEANDELFIKIYSPEELEKLCSTGIPCWLVNNVHKGSNYPIGERIAYYLQRTPELEEARDLIQSSLTPKLEESNILLSVIPKPRRRREKFKSDIFNIYDVSVAPPKDILKPESARSTKRKSSLRRNKTSLISLDRSSSINARASTIKTSLKQRDTLMEIPKKLTARTVIDPGDKYTYKVIFTPTRVGVYNHTFTIEVVGWPSKYYIECKGKCEIPSFNVTPSVMFEKVIEKKHESKLYDNCSYFLEEQALDFGTVLLPASKEIKEKNIITSATVTFVNDLSQTCETEIFLTEDRISSGVFALQPNVFLVPPGETKEVVVCSKPFQPGRFSGIALVLIKNNPEILAVHLRSAAINVSVAFEPKSITFERTTLNCTTSRTTKLTNLSPVTIRWRAIDEDDILENFKVRPLSGRIGPNARQKIEFTFKPHVTADIPKKYLKIMVYDATDTSTVLYTETIGISAEVINIQVECDKEINFGEVKGRMTHIYNYQILSKIKYNMDCTFIIIPPSTAEDKAIRDLFHVSPQHVQLKCGKVADVDIIFFPKRFVDFINFPLFHCVINDPATKNVVMSFDIKATATAYVAKFKLCPEKEVDFGHQLLGCEKSGQITLENTGKFDFSYVIVDLGKGGGDSKKKKKKKKKGKKGKKGSKDKGNKAKSSSNKSKSESKNTKTKTSKSSKSTKSSKKKESKKNKKDKKSADKKAKPKPTKLSIGCFTIISSTGVLEPGECVSINIAAKSKKVGVFEETVLIHISECELAYKKGMPVRLSVTSVVPKYNFTNIRDIFCEQYVVNTMADFNCPEQASNNHIFVIEENTLHLNKVGINSICETHIKIQSASVITTSLTASIDDNTNFSISPAVVMTEAYGYAHFTITFKPNAIKTYECILRLSHDGATSTPNSENQFTITITGEGYMPEIVIIEPEPDPIDNSYSLIFNPLLVGERGEKIVIFENTGPVSFKVMADICYDTANMLSLSNDQIPRINLNLDNDLNGEETKTSITGDQVTHNTRIEVEPYSRITLRIVFKPYDEINVTALLKLRIINNPYDVYCVNIRIESILEDIIITGLKAASFFNENRGARIVSRYELDLGYCTLNTLKTKRFTISNKSKVFIYRFNFTNFDKLKFSPAIGHLKPGASKQVLLTFFAQSSINLVKESMQCTICKIQYVEPETEPLSWDDRQNVVLWQELPQITERKSTSAPISNRRLSRKSSTKLKKKSIDDLSSAKQSLGVSVSKKSSSSVKITSSDVKKTKSDPSDLSVKQKKVESKPEPPYINLPETMRGIELILSITADYCTYKSSASNIIMEDTLMFEKRTATFEIENTSVMPLTIEWLVNMNECYPRRINASGVTPSAVPLEVASDALANIVQPRLVKSAKQRPVYLIGNEKFLSGNCTPVESMRSSTIFSDDGSLTNRSRDSWHENDFMPFTIDFRNYTLPPLSSKEFKITFSPIDVFEYVVHLNSAIPNLRPGDPGLEVIVQAKSLLPLYHFDIMPTNYLSRRQPTICGDIADDNTKVVEFDAVGLNIEHVKTFNVINPTGESFDFKWKSASTKNNDISLFHCNTPEGSVAKGKVAESSFTFIPQRHGTFEAFYIFAIEKYDINATFLLTAVARNPCVFFSANHVSMKGTLINVVVTDSVILQNNEDFPLDFGFKRMSLLNKDRTRTISVEPMNGTLKPNSKFPISLAFKASQTGEVDFKIKCNVEKMNKSLTLSVTTNVYDVELELSYLHDNRQFVLNPTSVNTIELRTLVTREESSTRFQITNKGKIGFYYNWQCVEKCSEDYARITFENAEGYCPISIQAGNSVTITPNRQLLQKRLKTVLQILHGPKYIISFICTTTKANYKFSFNEYDFGNCLLQSEKTTYYNCTLEFTNMDQQAIMLEYDGEIDENFSILFKSKPIQPKEIEKIPVYFHPKEIGNYEFNFKFFANSKVEIICVRGSGTSLVIELVDQEQKFINLGAVLAGKQAGKTVQVMNRSNAKIYVIFDLYNRLPIHHRPKRVLEPEYEKEEVIVKKKEQKKAKKGKKGKKGKGSKGSKKSSKSSKSTKSSKTSKSKKSKKSKSSKSSKKSKSTKSGSSKGKKGKKNKKHKAPAEPEEYKETAKERMERLISESIEITPKKFIKILPNSTNSFSINFSPKEKMVSFTRKIFYQVQDQIEPLCLIKGSCIAADYYLDRQRLTFGTVVRGCSNSRKFTLFNTGDIGGRYKWKFEKFEPNITLEPSEGYISPDMSIVFIATYYPKALQCFATARARCNIENYHQPLRIEFTGSCIKKPGAISTLKFSCPVRARSSEDVAIENTTSEYWSLKPKIMGSHFIVQESFHVPSLSKASLPVEFVPTTMTTKEHPHKATLQLVLPGGHCLIYNLEGRADAPQVVNHIERDIYCKTQFNETLEVQNWLKSSQQFKVITQNMKANETKLILYKITGNSAIDVPADGKRQYKWGIFVMNIGTLNFQVIFKNESTREYLFYEIKLNVKQGGPLAEINISTCVRIPSIYKLKLENPLKKEVLFNISSNCERLEYEKAVVVEPCSEKIIDITYIPVLPGETDANLEVNTKELGVFLYHLHLEANDPVPETPIVFKCPLGQSTRRKISLHNYSKSRADFRVKLQDKNIFLVDNETPSSPPDGTLFLTVTFEPNALGNIQSSLTLTSQTAGQFIYPLIGTCINPTPQGPISVRLGGSTTITFKNPFEEELDFFLETEPDIFQVKPIMETVPGRRNMKVIISAHNAKCDVINNNIVPFTGKLTITYAKCHVPNLKWVFYLQSDFGKTL